LDEELLYIEYQKSELEKSEKVIQNLEFLITFEKE
jgi:hypothetical protein